MATKTIWQNPPREVLQDGDFFPLSDGVVTYRCTRAQILLGAVQADTANAFVYQAPGPAGPYPIEFASPTPSSYPALALTNGQQGLTGYLNTAGLFSGQAGNFTSMGALGDTATVTDALVLGHNTPDTPANGFGTRLVFRGKSSSTPDQGIAAIRGDWITATHSSRRGRLSLFVQSAETSQEALRVTGNVAGPVGLFLGTFEAGNLVGNGAALTNLNASAVTTGTLPASVLPPIAISNYLGAAANEAAMLALVGQAGDWCTRSDLGTTWIIAAEPSAVLANWVQLSYPALPATVAHTNITNTFTAGQSVQGYFIAHTGVFYPPTAIQIPLIARGFTGQTADLQQWQDGAATILARVDALGRFVGDGSQLTNLPSATDTFYRYSVTTTMADPSVGKLRFNNAAPVSATQIAIAAVSDIGIDRTQLLKSLIAGDVVYIQDQGNAANWVRFRLTAAPTDNTTWFLLTLGSATGAGAAPTNNSQLLVSFGQGGGTLPGTLAYTDVANTFTASPQTFVTSSAAATPIVVKGAASQTADLQQWQDSSANVLTRVKSDGTVQTPTGTAAAPAIRLGTSSETGTLFGSIANFAGLNIGAANGTHIACFETVNIVGLYFPTHPRKIAWGDGFSNSPLVLQMSHQFNGGLAQYNGAGTGTVTHYFGVGKQGDTNTEYLSVGHNGSANGAYLQTGATGTGSVRPITVLSASAAVTPLVVKANGTGGETLQQWANSAGTVCADLYVDTTGQQTRFRFYNPADGLKYGDFGFQSGNANIFFHTAAWYNAAVTYNAGFQVGNYSVAQFSGGLTSYGSRDLSLQAQSGFNTIAYPSSAANVGFVVKGQASQTADLQQWLDSSSNVKARVDKDGQVIGTNLIARQGGGTAGTDEGVIYHDGNALGFINRDSTVLSWPNWFKYSWFNAAGNRRYMTLINGGTDDTTIQPMLALPTHGSTGQRAVIYWYDGIANGGLYSMGVKTDAAYGGSTGGDSQAAMNFFISDDAYGTAKPRLGINPSGEIFFGGNPAPVKINTNTNAAVVPLIVRGAASQTADFQQWMNSGGTVFARATIDAGGNYSIDAPGFRAIPLVGTNATFQIWKDTTPTKAVAIAGSVPGSAVTDDLYIASYSAGWTELWHSENNGNTTGTHLHIPISNAGRKGAVVKAAASQTANLQEWQDSGAAVLTAIAKNGAIKVAQLADGDAENSTLYYSTTASKLVYKDGSGVVNNLY